VAGRADVEHSVSHDLFPALNLYEVLILGWFEMELDYAEKR